MKVNVSGKLMHKMNILSSEFRVEVGGYLTGKIVNGELFLDDVLIPNQRISSTSDIISPEHQIALRKQHGDKVKNIVGHWHSHHNMGAFWSATDTALHEGIMQYKEYFVFIVSSNGQHLAKVCVKKPLSIERDRVGIHMPEFDAIRAGMKELMSDNSFSSSEFDNEDDDDDEDEDDDDDYDEDEEDEDDEEEREDWTDGDKLDCVKCDRFVSSVNEDGLCPECASEEEHAWPKPEEKEEKLETYY